jgi:hypothetical protein
MPVYLKCIFSARDEKLATFQQSKMFERVESVIDDSDIKITLRSLVPCVTGKDEWELRWTISANWRQEEWVFKRVRDAIGSPWDTRLDGHTRMCRRGIGGFADAFSLCSLAEVSVKRPEDEKGFFGRFFG